MNVTVRLYWQHDLDLVALSIHPEFDIGKWIKRAVIAWAREDKSFYIPSPLFPQPYSAKIESTTIHFKLSPEKEADVISCIHGIRTGFRNSAMKLIFRTYLRSPYMAPYYDSETFQAKARGNLVSAVSIERPSSSHMDMPRPDIPIRKEPETKQPKTTILPSEEPTPAISPVNRNPKKIEPSVPSAKEYSTEPPVSEEKAISEPQVYQQQTEYFNGFSDGFGSPSEYNSSDSENEETEEFDLFGAVSKLM